ncbi:hypothetical protein B9J83_03770, partial [Vibrio sp. V07_P2A8T137]
EYERQITDLNESKNQTKDGKLTFITITFYKLTFLTGIQIDNFLSKVSSYSCQRSTGHSC